MEYYDISKMKSMNPHYAFIVGGRSNGKSHAVARMILESYLETGAQFVRIVRYIFDLQSKYVEDYFDDNNKKWLEEHGYRVWYDSPYYYIAPIDNLRNKDILGYVLSLSTEQKYKSNQYDRVKKVILEEFALLDPTKYMSSEIENFLSLLSTIVRMRKDVTVWFVGNTISKYNPYFSLLHINIDKLKLQPGDIKQIPQPDLGYDEKPRVFIEFAKMAYEDAAEIPTILKVGANDTATTGLYMTPEDVKDSAELKWNKLLKVYCVQIGDTFFQWNIFPCFAYWQCMKIRSLSPDMIVKSMCYNANKYFWNCMEQLKSAGTRIPLEWYYDSEETKQFIYENILKDARRYLL